MSSQSDNRIIFFLLAVAAAIWSAYFILGYGYIGFLDDGVLRDIADRQSSILWFFLPFGPFFTVMFLFCALRKGRHDFLPRILIISFISIAAIVAVINAYFENLIRIASVGG